MARRLNGRSFSIHFSYSVSEIADRIGRHRGSVLRWIKQGDLKPVDSGIPILVTGEEVQAFVERRKPKCQKCATDEAYCMKCRQPRGAAFGEAEIQSANRQGCNVRFLCATCSTVMHRRYAWRDLPALARKVSLAAPERFRHLVDCHQPCLNVHYREEN